MKRNFFTQYNYDPGYFKGEINNEPSMVDVTVYESLSDKIARFCSYGHLPRYEEEYSDCDDDPTNDVSFDIMDYDLGEVEDLIRASKLQPVSERKEEAISDSGRVGPQIASSSPESPLGASSDSEN